MWLRPKKKIKAQAITEYAVLLGIIVMAIVLIQVYLKRSIQGKFKSTADDIGEQFTTGTNYTVQTIQQSARREISGNGTIAQLNNTWSSSEIQTATDGARPIIAVSGIPLPVLTAYAGHEITQKDFVNATRGGTAALGTHGTFDSGKLSGKNLTSEGE